MSSAIEFRGEALSLAEAARKYDLPKTTLANRLNLGWSVERALTTPARGGRAQTAPRSTESTPMATTSPGIVAGRTQQPKLAIGDPPSI